MPVTVEASNGGAAITGLSASNFALTLGTTPLDVTSVSASSTEAGVYNVTFTVPDTSVTSGEALTFAVNGVTDTASTVSGVTINSTAVPTAATLSAPNSSSVTFNGATDMSVDGLSSLSPSSTYVLGTLTLTNASGNPLVGLPSSDFSATYGTSTTNLVSGVQATGDSYELAITTPSALSSTATAFAITVDGTAMTASTTYTIAAPQAVSYNSSVQFPTGNVENQLVAGKTYTISATLEDAYGNAVSGLTASNFAIGESATASPTTVSTALPLVGTPTVTAGSTAGSYTIAFVPSTTSATSEYLGLVVNSQSNASISTDTDTVAGSSTGLTVIARTASSSTSVAAAAQTLTAGVAQPVTFTFMDANG
ncbi:MAG: hypothetical protein OWS74_08955, partial [Firmicutes bacterium]|nr:hypothetical protein [Bacillota bacterium]